MRARTRLGGRLRVVSEEAARVRSTTRRVQGLPDLCRRWGGQGTGGYIPSSAAAADVCRHFVEDDTEPLHRGAVCHHFVKNGKGESAGPGLFHA